MSTDVALADPSATDAWGRRLGQTLPPRAVAYLRGDLGAGKSSLARAMLRSLGVRGPVKSPTYTLIERYPITGGDAAHLDLYRIAGAGELEFLGLHDLAADTRLWLVEWPERGGAALPPADLVLTLAVAGEGRQLQLLPRTDVGAHWLAAALAVPDLQAPS